MRSTFYFLAIMMAAPATAEPLYLSCSGQREVYKNPMWDTERSPSLAIDEAAGAVDVDLQSLSILKSDDKQLTAALLEDKMGELGGRPWAYKVATVLTYDKVGSTYKSIRYSTHFRAKGDRLFDPETGDDDHTKFALSYTENGQCMAASRKF